MAKLPKSSIEVPPELVPEVATSNDALPRALEMMGMLLGKSKRAGEHMMKAWGFPEIDLAQFHSTPEALACVPIEMARRLTVLPLAEFGQGLVVAMADIGDELAMDELRRHTGQDIWPLLASGVAEEIERRYGAAG